MHATGQIQFAENYLQEALSKQNELKDLPIEWHFIGQIQRNKTRDIAAYFSWVHGVDRLIIAQRLSQHRQVDPDKIDPLNICIQVNIDREESKGGCLPEELPELVTAISALPNLALRGVMVIPEAGHVDAFSRTRVLFEAVRANHANPAQWDTLSMGMSGDFAEAIAQGATPDSRWNRTFFGSRSASAL